MRTVYHVYTWAIDSAYVKTIRRVDMSAWALKALGHDISKRFVTKFKRSAPTQFPVINGTMIAKACRAITRNSTRKTFEYRGDRRLYVDLSS